MGRAFLIGLAAPQVLGRDGRNDKQEEEYHLTHYYSLSLDAIMFSILNPDPKAASLIIIQSDATQNPIPFLKTVISSTSSNKLHRTFLLALSIPPSCFVPHANVDVLDWTGKIPGYVPWSDPCAALLEHVQKGRFSDPHFVNHLLTSM